MIIFDNLSPEEQLKSVNKEIDRMHLMIKLSEESLIKLNEVKEEVILKIKQ